MQVGLPRPLRSLGQELQQYAAGAPAMPWAVAAPPFLADRKPHARRNLFGAQKIFVRRIFETAAVERHQTLVAAHLRPLIDGHRKMALAEQRAGTLAVPEPSRIETRIGAQAIRRLEIDDQERNRAIGVGLQDEATIEL